MLRRSKRSIDLALVCAALLSAGMFAATFAHADDWTDRRAAAANRPRRIVYNNDGNDATNVHHGDVAELLASRSAPLAGTQVDAICYCTISAGFGNFTHATHIGHRSGVESPTTAPGLLYAANIDPLAETVRFAHAHGMQCYWSMRMNDTHDSGREGHRPALLAENPLKRDHPEYLLGKPYERLVAGGWSGVNYSIPQVRDLAFQYVEEVCRGYDVDGVELDFTRHPVFFLPTTHGEPCGDVERAQMSDLLARIRAMADEVGRARGRPILITVRLPDSAAYCAAIGLDLDRWLRERLVDVLVPGGYFQVEGFAASVALGKKYGVPVLCSLDDPRFKDEPAQAARLTDLAYRARAANAWAAGANGIYLFNLFDPTLALWKEMGDPHELATLDKDYFASTFGTGRAAGGNLPPGAIQTVETLSPADPRALSTTGVTKARIDLAEAEASGVTFALRVRLDKPIDAQTVAVTLNGHAERVVEAKGNWLKCNIAPADIVAVGTNVVGLTTTADKLKWLDAVIEVRHGTR